MPVKTRTAVSGVAGAGRDGERETRGPGDENEPGRGSARGKFDGRACRERKDIGTHVAEDCLSIWQQ